MTRPRRLTREPWGWTANRPGAWPKTYMGRGALLAAIWWGWGR